VTLFRYTAVGNDGESVSGTLEAGDSGRAARILQAKALLPLNIDPADAVATTESATTARRRWRGGRSATVDLFTLELTTLLDAGLPLAQALDTLAELSDDESLARLARTINKAVRHGRPLSEALKASDGGFDDFYCNMVRAGESSGALDLALARLSAFRNARRELRQSLVSALIYPSILLVLAIVAVMILLAFVVPQFTVMFADAGRELPLLTRLVAGTGELLTRWWWAILLTLGGTGWWLYQDWSTPAGRARWDAWLLRLPLVGDLLRTINTARFTRTLASLLENGINLVPALEIAREIVANTVLSKALGQVVRRVREGEGLSAPLADTGQFPPLATQLIRVGESSGRLERMLAQVAGIYERDVQTTLKRFLTLAEPAIILGVAVLVTVIILSVVLMILESNSLAF
jgi:general secretion pathway protein F